MSAFGDAVEFIGDNDSLLSDKVVEHLALSFASIGIALAIAVPLGVWLGHIHRGSFLAINAANVGRALPSLAVIAFGITAFGLGSANTIVALVVLAVPPVLTNTYTAVDQVDPDMVDAARGMGMQPGEVLTRVELPLALPLMFAGIRTAAIYVIATATLAVFAGGGGLGEIIANPASYGDAGVLAAAIVVAALAIAADLLFAALQHLVTPRALRRTHRRPRAVTNPQEVPYP